MTTVYLILAIVVLCAVIGVNDGALSSPSARWKAKDIESDTINGTPRTGQTTDPRSAVGHIYIHGKSYLS